MKVQATLHDMVYPTKSDKRAARSEATSEAFRERNKLILSYSRLFELPQDDEIVQVCAKDAADKLMPVIEERILEVKAFVGKVFRAVKRGASVSDVAVSPPAKKTRTGNSVQHGQSPSERVAVRTEAEMLYAAASGGREDRIFLDVEKVLIEDCGRVASMVMSMHPPRRAKRESDSDAVSAERKELMFKMATRLLPERLKYAEKLQEKFSWTRSRGPADFSGSLFMEKSCFVHFSGTSTGFSIGGYCTGRHTDGHVTCDRSGGAVRKYSCPGCNPSAFCFGDRTTGHIPTGGWDKNRCGYLRKIDCLICGGLGCMSPGEGRHHPLINGVPSQRFNCPGCSPDTFCPTPGVSGHAPLETSPEGTVHPRTFNCPGCSPHRYCNGYEVDGHMPFVSGDSGSRRLLCECPACNPVKVCNGHGSHREGRGTMKDQCF